ncbi:lipid-transfer protein [Rhodococcus koreensis]|uniref:propanoyl-CoA C-acyltransferase n=1 Tax=Rhodococcus koreensis TaxID=99653 RepID=A0A1H4X7W4_9NOCA|nr:lipid-transfer protein [Rhodococcus koreensis]SED01657.1 Acetyl-CoA acetyltransferase [Rhodococcus koreensis]
MSRRVLVAGVGMVPFAKPGKSEDYFDMGAKAIRAALSDAGLGYETVEQAFAGYVYGDSTSGQRAIYNVGMTGIPIVNVNNNCASGSSALWLARQVVESGAAECVLAVGFEQMRPGPLLNAWGDRPVPMGRHLEVLDRTYGVDRDNASNAMQFFGGATQEYCKRYGVSPDLFAKISVKSRKHAANNPYAVFRDPVTEQEVLDSPALYGGLTRLQACPPTCGAGAAIVCSDEFARKHGITPTVAIAAQALSTDFPDLFTADDMLKVVGADITKAAAAQVYETAGVDPRDIKVVELHDCFSINEVLCYEALGLVEEGGSEKFILDGDNTYGGRVVVNPSGGLLSKGHPLGATGLAQCAELVWQLRGTADARQVDDVTVALQHNLGLGGAGVVTLYEKVS